MLYARLFVLLLGCAGILYAPAARAQFGSLRGRVLQADSREPLPNVHVALDDEAGRRTGTATDAEGHFLLASIPPGRYVLRASYVGFAPFVDTLAFEFGTHRTLEIALAAEETSVGDVTVEAERGADAPASIPAGMTTIRPSDLARVPMPGGSSDLAAYLLTLPGVVSPGDRGGQLFIRGGTPTQNLVLIDGMPLYQPFHIVGFYSAFPADIVSYADVYAGGFGARYGGMLSSVIDVATRNGNKRRLGAAVSAAPFLSAARVELPVVPGQVSLLASLRESMIERFAPDLLGQRLPYRFGDRFVKLHAFLNQTSSLSLTALRTFDEGNVARQDTSERHTAWRNAAYGGRFLHLPPDFPALFQASFFLSRFSSRHRVLGTRERAAAVHSMGGEAEFIYYLGITEVHGGLFARTYAFAYEIGAGGPVEEALTEGGVFLEALIDAAPGLRLEPGLRLHSFPSRSRMTLEPRLRAAWRPGGRTGPHVFTAAWGVYHQQIVGLYNLRDVTDAFVVWAPSPQNLDIPTAVHGIVGWQGRLGGGLELTTELYVKRLSNMVSARYGESPGARLSLTPADGLARGLDLKVELTRPAFYAQAAYGLAAVVYETRREADRPAERFPPPHDRRHQLDLLARLSRWGFDLGVRWQFGSGLPFTQSYGFYEALPTPRPGERRFRTQPGQTVVLPAAPYGARLPAYHRLDVSLARRFTLGPVDATLQAALINAYDRANIFDYDLLTGRRVDQLPLIPSLSLHLEVR